HPSRPMSWPTCAHECHRSSDLAHTTTRSAWAARSSGTIGVAGARNISGSSAINRDVTTETRAGADADEFTRVYRAERNRLRRVAYLMAGQAAVAEGLVHDAFVRLHQQWATVDVPAAYLRTTLVRLC